jgi:hypothetical protein
MKEGAQVSDMPHLISSGVPSSRVLLNRLIEQDYSLYDYESVFGPMF